MAKQSEAGAEAPAQAEFQDTVLNLLQEMTASIQGLQARVDAVEKEPARFIDPNIEARSRAADRTRRALEATPDGIPHSNTIPLFPNGERVPAMVMRQFAPKFGEGDIVRFNLDAVPHGRSDGKTRGQLMAEMQVPDGYGEVIDRTFLSDQHGSWKYRVKFPTRTAPGATNGVITLYEREMQLA